MSKISSKLNSMILKKFRSITGWSIFALLVSAFGTCAKSLIAGKCLNENGVSTIAIVASILSIIIFVGAFFSNGIAYSFSDKMGKFEKEKAARIFGSGLVTCVLAGIMMALIFYFFKKPILSFYGASEELTSYCNQYMKWLVFTALVYPIYWLLYQMVFVDGDAILGTIAELATAATNIVLGIVLTRLFPNKAISMLALTEFISYAIEIIVLCIHFFRKRNSISISFKIDFKELFNSFKFTLSSASTYLFDVIYFIIMDKFVISFFGEQYLAIETVISQMMTFFFILYSAEEGITPFVGAYHGEENSTGIRKVVAAGLRWELFGSLIITLVFACFAHYIPGLFGFEDELLIEECVRCVRIFSFTALGYNLGCYFITYYCVSEHTTHSLILSALLSLFVTVPVGIVAGLISKSYIVMRVTIGFATFLALALIVLGILIFNKKKTCPLLLDKKQIPSFCYDLKLSKENIVKMQQELEKYLNQYDVTNASIYRTSLLVEELCLELLEHNTKTVFAEVSLILKDDDIKLIIKDNGVKFELSNQMFEKEDDLFDVISLNKFVSSKLVNTSKAKAYLQTTGYNRNYVLISKNL